MATSSAKVELDQKGLPLSLLGMIGILLAFLYPHLMVLFAPNTADKAHALSVLINQQFKVLSAALSLGCLVFVSLKALCGIKVRRATIYALWLLLMASAFLAFNIDTYVIYGLSVELGFAFILGFEGYWAHTSISYAALWLAAWLLIGLGILTEGHHKPLFGYAFLKRWGRVATGLIPFAFILPLLFCAKSHLFLVQDTGSDFLFTLQALWVAQCLIYITVLSTGLKCKEFNRGFVSQQLKIMLILAGLLFAAELVVFLKFALGLSNGNTWPYHQVPTWPQRLYAFTSIMWPVMVLALISYSLWRYHHGRSKLGEDEAKISQDFGSARFATRHDLKEAGFYNESIGPILGIDDDGLNLHTPLVNKLIISPPGGGKTTSSSIPLLLQHEGPVFVFDVKGELWAVTAEHRHKTMGREVVTIDPFKITQQRSFTKGKSGDLLKEYHINPFEWLPQEPEALDRVINAFASSFLVNSDTKASNASHFDENAKILIRGYIDYLVRSDAETKSLPELFKLLSSSFEDNKEISKMMIDIDGRAKAASNQIGRVGANERGSILSTTYRQVDWLGDSNVSRILHKSNFNLKDYLKGNMDIYIIVPEDQIKEHGRLMRMMMALLMGQIIQADPRDLPDKKIVFLLEELAQMGNYPDVEQCIEVLRARNVVVWAVFQTLSQIELFDKPDLFKSAPLKQIFTTDDVKTMEWVQAMAGKKTILTKAKSEDKGKSRQSSQWFGGSTSTSKGESIHETGVDLLPLNEIREMDKDTQLVFYAGKPVIRCKKARYFEDEKLRKLAGFNPLA